MQQRHPSLPAVTLVLLLGLLVLYPLLVQPVVPYDEGFVLERARRVLHGEVPHRDFWSIYPAGQYHLIALAFGWFGESISSARLVDATVRLLMACTIAWSVAQGTRKALPGVATGGLAVLCLAGTGFPAFPGFTAMLLILGSASLWSLAPCMTRPMQGYAMAGSLDRKSVV